MDNRRAGVLTALLASALSLFVLAIYANASAELPAEPSFLVGFVTGLLAVAAMALLYLAGKEIGSSRRGS